MIRLNRKMRRMLLAQRRSKIGKKGADSRRVFDAVAFFSIASELPKPPHKLGLELFYHVTKGWRWRREEKAEAVAAETMEASLPEAA